MKDTCFICEHCSYVKTKEYDCCDVMLYKCDITNEILDEFHIDRKACAIFYPKDWVSG